jgi:hypothetical protein
MRKSFALPVITAALVLIGLPLAVPTVRAQVTAEHRLSMYVKPAVVRIWDGYTGTFVWYPKGTRYNVQYGGSGSGAFIDPNGYIVTNAHVTDLTHQGEEHGKELLFKQFCIQLARDYDADPRAVLNNPDTIASIRRNSAMVAFNHIHHVVVPNGDSFPFEIKAFGAPIGQGKDVSIIKIELKNAPIVRLGNSDMMQLQDHVTVVGYPGAADTFDTGTLDAKSALEASITDGKVSAKKNAADGAPILQISAAATHGNSGGPVLSDNAEVIGLLTFRGDTVNGQEVSGFSFVVPTSTVIEFVKQAGCSNTPGPVDQLYRDGLELYWGKYYSKAIKKFEEAKRLFPQHSELDRLIQDSQSKIAAGEERWDMTWPLVIGGALGLVVLLVVIAGVVGIVVVKGRKSRAAAAAQAAPMPVPGSAPALPPHPPLPSLPPPSPPSYGPAATQAIGGVQTGDKTVAISSQIGAVATSYGTLTCTSGALAGQSFVVRSDGIYIGRDGTLSQIVIPDGRVSKRHVWVGPRGGRVAVVDQGSTNGTFLNVPGSQRITEVFLNPGDTVIISEADVARFRYQS